MPYDSFIYCYFELNQQSCLDQSWTFHVLRVADICDEIANVAHLRPRVSIGSQAVIGQLTQFRTYVTITVQTRIFCLDDLVDEPLQVICVFRLPLLMLLLLVVVVALLVLLVERQRSLSGVLVVDVVVVVVILLVGQDAERRVEGDQLIEHTA